MTSQDKTSNAENNAQNSLTAKVYRTSEYLDVWDAVLVKYCRMQRKSRIQSPLVQSKINYAVVFIQIETYWI